MTSAATMVRGGGAKRFSGIQRTGGPYMEIKGCNLMIFVIFFFAEGRPGLISKTRGSVTIQQYKCKKTGGGGSQVYSY